MMQTSDDLRTMLGRMDGRGYKAYKALQGCYQYDQFELCIDHVQGDPFAAPSKIRIRVPQSIVRIPPDLLATRVRRLAVEDFLIRSVHRTIQQRTQRVRGIGKSGLIYIDVGGQEVLERTAMKITDAWAEARMEVGLPASGRTVLGTQAIAMLCEEIPHIMYQGLFWAQMSEKDGRQFVTCVENQEHLRKQLASLGLVAFIGDGSMLPRLSGVSDQPFTGPTLQPFQSPDSLRVTLPLLHPVSRNGSLVQSISGMGIPQGITLIVGGGYHGKSTLLRALERGVYPHIPGDGREYVVTTADAVKVRAEDGRSVQQVNLCGFMTDLPFAQDTTHFSTENASGSTSQAATILEALEMQAGALLLDEDTSATNFMVRDARMQALVAKPHEPITPFLDRVRELYEREAVSIIVVIGGCGDYFDVADTVIMMRDYQPIDVTQQAQEIVRAHPTRRQVEVAFAFPHVVSRIPIPHSIDASRGRRAINIDAKDRDVLQFGQEVIILTGVEQIVDISQTRAIGYAIYGAARRLMKGKRGLKKVIEILVEELEEKGLESLTPFSQPEGHPGNFARPRSFEIASTLNRFRSIKMDQRSSA